MENGIPEEGTPRGRRGAGNSKGEGTLKILREYGPWLLAVGALIASLRALPVEQKALAQSLTEHEKATALERKEIRAKVAEVDNETRALKGGVQVLQNDRVWIRESLVRIETAIKDAHPGGMRRGRAPKSGSRDEDGG